MSEYDVFLAHNKTDQAAVKALARRLEQESQLNPSVDEWNLSPGESWRVNLQRTLDKSRTCAVFLGPEGQGSWENEEMRAYVRQRVQEDKEFRLIPVLLPGATMPQRGQLPGFLSRLVWVTFRNSLDDSNPYRRLVSGIKGIVLAPSLIERLKTPYRGLEKFRPKDAKLFFGRDSETQQLVEELKKSRFLAVLGASGSGKSSVVLAGLVPALQKGDLIDSKDWLKPIIFTPTEQPLHELAVRLAELFPDQMEYMAQMGQLLQDLESNENTLHLTVSNALKNAPSRVVLVVDQFEEAFTLCQNAHTRQQFFANLLYASEVHGGRTVVILTMRADFLAKCAEYPELADRLSTFNFFVTPMVESQLREAIERPAARAGVKLEDGLADLMLKEVKDQAGGLPLLEHTLLELWKRRDKGKLTFNAYQEIGGVTGALAHTANATYDEFKDQQPKIAQRILLQLVQPGEGTEDTRRRAKLSELVNRESDEEIVEVVLQRLADKRLVTISQEHGTGETVVNIAHEALIRNWPRLRQWIDQNRENLRFQRRLTDAAEEWVRLGRDEGALYRGVLLAQAEEWTQERPDNPSELEREFIDASTELTKEKEIERERQRQHKLEQEQALVKEQTRRLVLQRWALTILSLLLVVAVVATLFAFKQAQDAEVARNQAKEETNRAEQEAKRAYAGQLAAQAQDVLEEDPQRSLLLAVEALTDTMQLRVPAAEQTLRDALANTGGIGLSGHSDSINAVAISEKWVVTGSKDKTARVWNLSKDGSIDFQDVLTDHTEPIKAVAISPDNHLLVTVGDDKIPRVWDLNNLKNDPITLTLPYSDSIKAVAISDQWLVTASTDRTIYVWGREQLETLPEPTPRVLKQNFSAKAMAINGHKLVTANGDKAILWHLNLQEPKPQPIPPKPKPEPKPENCSSLSIFSETENCSSLVKDVAIRGKSVIITNFDGTTYFWDDEQLDTPKARFQYYSSQAFAISNQWFATASLDGITSVWDMLEPKDLSPIKLKGHSDFITAIAISNDWLLTGSDDNTARLWNLGQPEAASIVLQKDQNFILDAAAISLDDHWLVTSSDENSVRLWNIEQPDTKPIILGGDQSPIKIVAVSPDSHRVVIVRYDQSACLSNLTPSGAECIELKGDSTINAVAINNKWVVTGGDDKIVRLWDLNQPKREPIILSHNSSIKAVAISRKWLVTTSFDKRVYLWDLGQLNAPPTILKGNEKAITTVAISPNEKWLIGTNTESIASLWNLQQLQEQSILLKEHEDRINAVAISDKWLVTASSDQTAHLWNLEQLKPDNPILLQGHQNSIFDVAISPDNKWLVTGSSDNTARLWDLQRLEAQPVVLRGHTGSIHAVGISRNQIATASFDGTARLWHLQLDELIDLACRTAGRNLTLEEWQLYIDKDKESYRQTCPDLPVHYTVAESEE